MADEVILTTDEQLWDVLTPLLDTLKKTVATKFPEEAIAANRLDIANRAVESTESEKALINKVNQTVSDLVQTHKDIDEVSNKLSFAEWDLPKEQEKEEQLKQKVNTLQSQLDTLGDSEKDKKVSLGQSLKEAKASYEEATKKREATEKKIESTKMELIVLRGRVDSLHKEANSTLEEAKSSDQSGDKEKNILLKERINAISTEVTGILEKARLSNQSGNRPETLATLSSLKEKMVSHKEAAEKNLVTSKAQVATFTKEVTTLKEKYRTKRDKIMTAIDSVERHKDKKSTYAEMSSHLKGLADVTPGIYGQTVKDFNTACNCAEHLRKEVNVREDLSKKYTDKMKSPGDTHTINVEVEVGVGFEVLIANIRATVIVGMEVEVTKLGTGKLQAKRKLNSKLNIRGRAGVELTEEVEAKIRAGLKGVVSIDKGRTYDSMDDFISEESKTCLAAVMAGKGGKKQRKYITETKELLAEANNNFSQLQKRLTLMGALTDKNKKPPVTKKLLLTKQQHVDVVTSISKSASFDGSASSTFKVNSFGAGVSLGGGAKTTTTTQYRSISYLDDITEQPVLQKIYAMKNPKNMGFFTVDSENKMKYLTEQQAINELDRIEKDIANLKSQGADAKLNLEVHQQNLLNSIKLLHAEYDSYVTLQNYIDNTTDKGGDAGKRITELKARRSAGSTADYVKSMALQFATLRGLYESSFDSPSDVPDEAKSLSTSFSEDLKIPRMKMSGASLKKAFGTEAQTNATVVNSFNGSFSVDIKAMGDESTNTTRGGLKFKVAASYEQKQVPDQPDQESFKLKFNTTLGAKGDNYIAQLFQIADITKRFKDDAVDIQNELKAVFDNVADGCVEIDFVKLNGRWALKSAKGYDEQDKKIGGKVSVGTDVQFIAGLTVESKTKRLRNVYFGSKTLSALTDIYRAKHFGNADSDANWGEFRKKSNLLKKMVTQLKAENPQDEEAQGNVKKQITKDIEEWLGALSKSSDPEDNDAVQKFRQVWNNGQGQDTAIEEALSKLVTRKVKLENKATSESFLRRRNMERHEINDYAVKLITNDMEKVLTEYKADLGDEPINKVDDLVKKAKAAYKKDKSERNFKLLKKAFAIDYASKQLDELVRHGNVEDQNKAIAMLGSEMQSILDGDKIYMNDRVEGKLIRKDSGEVEVQPIIRKGLSKTIKASEITKLSTPIIAGLGATTLAPQMTNSSGKVVSWKASSYSSSTQDSYNTARFQKRHCLRSMKTRLKWSNKMSISEAISKVMADRYKKQQAQKKAALQRQRSSSSSQKSASV